jgi:hypothetical protein
VDVLSGGECHCLILNPQSCHFGKARWWLECPSCGRNSYALFLRGGCLACRVCQRLRYVSKTWTDPFRLMNHYAERFKRLRNRPGPKSASTVTRCLKYHAKMEEAMKKGTGKLDKLEQLVADAFHPVDRPDHYNVSPLH